MRELKNGEICLKILINLEHQIGKNLKVEFKREYLIVFGLKYGKSWHKSKK